MFFFFRYCQDFTHIPLEYPLASPSPDTSTSAIPQVVSGLPLAYINDSQVKSGLLLAYINDSQVKILLHSSLAALEIVSVVCGV